MRSTPFQLMSYMYTLEQFVLNGVHTLNSVGQEYVLKCPVKNLTLQKVQDPRLAEDR